MAFDKGQLVMRQVQMKSKRMESALIRFVESFSNGDKNAIEGAYFYALGCLGGDYLKKQLFKTSKFEEIVLELKANKLMKAETADKNIALWHERMDGNKYEDENAEADNATVETENKEEPTICDDSQKKVCFGKTDEHGDVVPDEKKVVCEYAEVPRPEGMREFQSSFSSSNDTRRIIACY